MATVRRWRVPPPPALPFGAADGAGVLAEDPSRLGVVLWDLARDVLEWAGCSRREHDALVAPGAGPRRLAALLSLPLDPALACNLEEIARAAGDPSRVDRARLALACEAVSAWADREGALATAAVFAHATAALCPGNPRYAYQAGRLARRRADYPRAEAWLCRAILLGRQCQDRETYARAYSGLGNVYGYRGKFSQARKHHRKCLRTAACYGLRELTGNAHHDLLLIATEAGEIEEARTHARGALDAYGAGHRLLPRVSHDVALLLVNQGEFAAASAVLRVLLPHFRGAPEYLVVVGTAARAAGGAGQHAWFRELYAEAADHIENATGDEYHAPAYLALARGAESLGQGWPAAELAGRALQVAVRRGESLLVLAAEGVLERVRRSGTPRTAPARCAPARASDGETERLATDYVEALACAGAC